MRHGAPSNERRRQPGKHALQSGQTWNLRYENTTGMTASDALPAK